MKMKRQGDLVIKKVDTLPSGLLQVKSGVILEGESTGHAHRLVGGQVFKDSQNLMYLNILRDAKIVHEEHKPITLSKGTYMVMRTREWDYSASKAREVMD
jgi:hypothetical protein